MAILTESWDADRYLHLALQESGYRHVEGPATPSACTKTAETFARGDRRILHVRLHEPFVQDWPLLAAARLETYGIACIESFKPARVFRLAPVEQIAWAMRGGARPDLSSVRARAMATISDSHYSPQIAFEVRPSELRPLARTYTDEAERAGYRLTTDESPAALLQKTERLMAARVWKAPSAMP
jgi:hypothetical protein